MDFDIKNNGFNLIVNSKEVVDLSKGFAGINDVRIRKNSKNPDNMYPERLDLTSRYRRYFVRIDQNRFYRMRISYEHDLKSQVVYQTNWNVSELFRSKCLNYILQNLDTQTEAFSIVRRGLTATLKMISDSYDFDVVMTDVPSITTLKLNVPIQLIDVSVTQTSDVYEDGLNLLIDKYGSVPLRVLPAEVMVKLDPKDTNLSMINVEGKKILLVSGINKYSCGWMYREMSKSAIVLPVTMFNLGSY